jgi:hypothetical protein
MEDVEASDGYKKLKLSNLQSAPYGTSRTSNDETALLFL